MSARLLVPREGLLGDRFDAIGDGHHYLSRVRRLVPGDRVVLFDGEGRERSGRIASIDAVRTEIAFDGEVRADTERHIRWIAILPFIKGERMERCLCQLAELGVDEIRLFRAARAVVTLSPEKEAIRVERYLRVLTSAASQSRRAMIPDVTGPFGLKEALTMPLEGGVPGGGSAARLFFYEGASGAKLGHALPERPPSALAFVTGPEGGFTEQEVQQAGELGFKAVGLGPFLLRADTAPVAALAMLQYRYLHHDTFRADAGS